MARPLRLEYAGAIYHVTSRGDRRKSSYEDDTDRLNWMATLANVCSRFNWRGHAYCLMYNHYHVVIETIAGKLSQGMRQLNGVYTEVSVTNGDYLFTDAEEIHSVIAKEDSELLVFSEKSIEIVE